LSDIANVDGRKAASGNQNSQRGQGRPPRMPTGNADIIIDPAYVAQQPRWVSLIASPRAKVRRMRMMGLRNKRMALNDPPVRLFLLWGSDFLLC
jgi:hypothetical protein